MHLRRLPSTDVLIATLSASCWTSQELADRAGVDIRTVQRARKGPVSRDVRRALYRLALSDPPPRLEPWRCPRCHRRSFTRVRWSDGTLTSWYRCRCGEWWLRHDPPPGHVPEETLPRTAPV